MNNALYQPEANIINGPIQFYVLHDVNLTKEYCNENKKSRLRKHANDVANDGESLEAEVETIVIDNDADEELLEIEGGTEGKHSNSLGNICKVICEETKNEKEYQQRSNINILMTKLDNLLPTGKTARKTKRSILWSACKFINRAQKIEKRLSACRRSKIYLEKKISAMKIEATNMSNEIQRLKMIVECHETENISENELLAQNSPPKAENEVLAEATKDVESPMNVDEEEMTNNDKESCISDS